jgi:hypothetical protein
MAPMMMTTARPSGPPVSRFSRKADELDLQVVEFVQHFEEVPDGPSYPVRGPHHHHLKAAAAGIAEQVIETWPAGFRPRDPVGVLSHDLKTPLLRHRAEVMELSLRMLVHGGYAQVKSYSFHISPSIEARTSRK